VGGITTGLLFCLLLGLPEYIFHVPFFSGAWLGIFASTSWVSNIGMLLLIFGAGPAIIYLSLSRINPEVKSDTRLRDRLIPGPGALSGSYFLIFSISILLEGIMPFSPDADIWAVVQCSLTLASFMGLRIMYSRNYGVALRWIPEWKETITFVMTVVFVLGILIAYVSWIPHWFFS